MRAVAGLCLVTLAASVVHAADNEDLDKYKWRVTASWWFTQPSGFFRGTTESSTPIDLNRDFGFGSYSTFSGGVDWRFKRKHHLLFGISPVESSRSATLTRTITFQGETYDVGAKVLADIKSNAYSPGYQWDFIRRHWGYLALPVQVYMLDTTATLSAGIAVNGQTATAKSSGSVFAPIPAIGLRSRWYPMHDSDRVVLDGRFQGMYLFGYGDFYAANGQLGVRATQHFKIIAGYNLGSRLSVHGSNNQIGLRLTQKGPVVGLEGSW